MRSSFSSILQIYCFFAYIVLSDVVPDEEEVNAGISILANSCIGREDGYHYLKLADASTVSQYASAYSPGGDGDDENSKEQTYPIVRIKCHNEYMILNHLEEPLIAEYFTSFLKWQKFVSGPSNTHVINWEQWYLPNEEDATTKFIVSPDCELCEEDSVRQLYGDKTIYMMTGTMYGCFWNFLGEHNFDEDKDTYQCYYNPTYEDSEVSLNEMGELTPFELNDYSSADAYDYSGVCAFNVRRSDFTINGISHDMCTVDFSGEDDFDVEMGYHLKPSIGVDGKYCVCTKPSVLRHFEVETTDLNEAKKRQKKYAIKVQQETEREELAEQIEEDDIMNIPRDKIYYLYQSDFEHGTLRIRESGTYIVMEDIIFDFNRGEMTDPSDRDAWWPNRNQHQLYPGAQSYRDAYFLGFWAGITIETNNVMLDLNGHELKMSDEFYYQQRWFTTIALQSQYFLPGQGPGFFGAEPTFAEHVVIRNGILGQSSHHNIHGHYNHDVLVENIHCRHFETHGIQFNGFDGITLRNIEIGPSSTKVFLRGTYGHARNLLPRLQEIADAQKQSPNYKDQRITFYGRESSVSVQEIHDDLKVMLDSIFTYVITNEEPVFDDVLSEDKWKETLKTFYNPTGLPHGAGMYGIFLNTVGASVLTYNLQTSTYSNNAVLENINIHDLKHSMLEFIRMGVPSSGSMYLNALHGCLDARDLLNDIDNFGEDGWKPTYRGNILTDATIAMEYFSNNWDILQASLIWGDRIFPWVTGEDIDAIGEYNIGCNSDAQVHGAKGLTGIRIDGVNDVHLKDVQINDMVESTPPGTDICGKYTKFDRDCSGKCGGHIRQKEPMQVGFSGHNLQGLCLNACKNVKVGKTNIDGLQSYYGLTYGISVWPSVDITFQDGISVTNLLAGVHYHYIVRQDEETGDIIYDDEVYENNYPNRIPEVCGIRIVTEYYSDTADKTYTSTVKFEDVPEKDILVTNIDGYKTCFVDERADDYYSGHVHGKKSKLAFMETMVGSYKGDDPNFVGIGKHGIADIKKYALNNRHDGNHGAGGWIQRNFKIVIFIGVILFILAFSFCLKKFCSHRIWNQDRSVLDSDEIKHLAVINPHGSVVQIPDDVLNTDDALNETSPLLQT